MATSPSSAAAGLADTTGQRIAPFASAWRRAHLTVDQRVARGRAARHEAPRSSHGRWAPAPDRPDPVALLEEQAASRVPQLVPVRYGRMLVSPFTFYRGAALIMASDLAATPVSGVTVQLCGDAHLSNFGLFGTPERQMIFDINDFDETLPGPWEWDVKRLAASFEIMGRDRGFARADRRADRQGRGVRVPGPDTSGRRDGGPGRLVRPPGSRDAAQAGPPGGPDQGRSARRRPGLSGRTWPRRIPGTTPACSPSALPRSRVSCGSSPSRR